MISQLSLQVLVAGVDDWVPLAAVYGLSRQLNGIEKSDAIQESMASIRELVALNLFSIGEVSEGGFFACDDSSETVMEIIANAVRTTDLSEWGSCIGCVIRQMATNLRSSWVTKSEIVSARAREGDGDYWRVPSMSNLQGGNESGG